MTTPIAHGQIELKVHGLTEVDHGRVPARVFANKLRQLVSALEAADELENGIKTHEYVLADMHMSQPTARLREVPFSDREGQSAIPVINEAVEAIKTNDARVIRLKPVVHHLGEMTAGAEKSFGFAEVFTGNNVFRIDDFLRRRAANARKRAKGDWYEGASYGSFDGKLDYVDVRGALPQFKLTLSAGGKEIDCICPSDYVEELGQSLDHRVRVHGRAIYASGSPIPMRVEVTKIEPVRTDVSLSRWIGSFEHFEPMPWDEPSDA